MLGLPLLFTHLVSITTILCTKIMIWVANGGLLRSKSVKEASQVATSNEATTKVMLMTFVAFIFDLVFAICLFIFTIAHAYMAIRNMTSIENGRRSSRYRLSTVVCLCVWCVWFDVCLGEFGISVWTWPFTVVMSIVWEWSSRRWSTLANTRS